MMLEWWVHIIVRLSKPIERTPRRVNPNVDYGLWGSRYVLWVHRVEQMNHAGVGCRQ